jgi:asparagine synthase (glutamine-hydrolysing)
MCGLLTYLGDTYSKEVLIDNANKIKYRGPDNSKYEKISSNISFIFHRLSIIDTSDLGNQPLHLEKDPNISIVCNGEIYNYKELISKYNFDTHSGSDCEVILHLYKRFGIKKALEKLDGVFAFVLYDANINMLFASRDPFGVRPLFYGKANNNEILFASEAKAISDLCHTIHPVPPGSWWSSDCLDVFTSYYVTRYEINNSLSEQEMCLEIRRRLVSAVEKRLMSEREIGCLLSGGLDSSLIAALVSHMLNGYRLIDDEWIFFKEHKTSIPVKTFSIGMNGSPDLKYAKKVAKWIGSEHNNVELSEADFLNAIEEVIYKIESFDTTTVRASVGNYLVSKFIKDNTECKVIFNGDGSDEACCGYVYNVNAPTLLSLQSESIRLLSEIYLFDVLRSDRSISSNGLEARTPFLDKTFVDLYTTIPPRYKSFDKVNKIEKYLLRKAFEEDNLLPPEVLWRHKCAFSDGVSSIKNSWHQSVKNFVDAIITDDEFKEASKGINHCRPLLKESFYYRKVFDSFFPGHYNLIPHFWMPKWTNVIDPSARELGEYKE